MDLKTFTFPEVTDVDIAFPTFDTIKELLAEAEARGFMDGHTPYNQMFSTLFYRGGKVKFKADVDPTFRQNAYRYFCAFRGSWAPKHEHKNAICALILSEICEPELDKS